MMRGQEYNIVQIWEPFWRRIRTKQRTNLPSSHPCTLNSWQHCWCRKMHMWMSLDSFNQWAHNRTTIRHILAQVTITFYTQSIIWIVSQKWNYYYCYYCYVRVHVFVCVYSVHNGRCCNAIYVTQIYIYILKIKCREKERKWEHYTIAQYTNLSHGPSE